MAQSYGWSLQRLQHWRVGWRRGVVVSGVRRMNEVNARRTRLVPGWVTVFVNVMYNKQHVLHSTLPGTMDTKHHLRPRPHNFKLTAKNSSITECDFITRMLFKDVY